MKAVLGDYLRKRRSEKRLKEGKTFSLRQVAARVDVEPSYLSKIERGIEPRPSEDTTRALAAELGEDPDVLLAMAGKVSSDLQNIIRKRPQLFAQLIRELKNLPDDAVLRIVREVRDGNW
jgi:HTH-type transcriptional regulator, competence development regulator